MRSQQGRAQIDADDNENVDIQLNDVRTGRIDMIGRHGAPEHDPGMEITIGAGGTSVEIAPGRYYVDGICCEHEAEAPIDFTAQPHLPDASLPTEPGLYLFYLDVWERPITAVQDPEIREVALGGPDTTTRTQIVWQVRALAVTPQGQNPHCGSEFSEWNHLVNGSTGTLEVRVAEAGDNAGPCIVPETAGLTAVENNLFRLQIHQGNFDPASPGGIDPAQEPDFKWSRDNGSMLAVWREHPSTLEVTVDRVGPGGAHGLSLGDWVELTNDDDDLLERPGVLAEIDDIHGDTLVLRDPPDTSVSTALQPVPQSDSERHSQARRWDSSGARSTTAGAEADVTADGWIRIADGLEARFSGGSFRSGAFWIVPTRTAVLPGAEGRQIDWPHDGAGNPIPSAPHGPRHHLARLALVDFDGTTWSNLRSCHRLFAPLSEMVHIDGRGGDGQHARGNHWLAAPVRVGVSRGDTPVPDARIRFALLPRAGGSPIGVLSAEEPNADGIVANPMPSLEVQTNAEGIAVAWWRLGPGVGLESPGDTHQPDAAQLLEATLLDSGDTPTNIRTRFVAQALDNVTLSYAGGDGQIGLPGETLEIALRVRVHDGTRPVAGALVLFSDLNRVLDGNSLDEFTGGAIHASANVVSSTPWPGGNRMIEAVVETDANGEAQVQFILGTAQGLPVQRVEAILLDDEGQETAQRHLFTAHLAIAREIGWDPCRRLEPMLSGEEDHNVQAALDAVCEALTTLQQFQVWVIQQLAALWQAVDDDGGPIVIPPNLTTFPVLREVLADPDRFLRGGTIGPTRPVGPGGSSSVRGAGPRVEAAFIGRGGVRAPLDVDTELSVSALSRIEIRPDFPLPSELSTGRRRMGLIVRAEEPLSERGGVVGRRWMTLEGRVSRPRGDADALVWTPSRGALRWLRQQLNEIGEPVALEVTVDQGVLTGEGRSSWTGRAFVVQ